MNQLSEFEIELLKNELAGVVTRISEWGMAMQDIYVDNQQMLSVDDMQQALHRLNQIERAMYDDSE